MMLRQALGVPFMPKQRSGAPKKAAASQSARFIEAAKKAGADKNGKRFERAFSKVVKAPKPTR